MRTGATVGRALAFGGIRARLAAILLSRGNGTATVGVGTFFLDGFSHGFLPPPEIFVSLPEPFFDATSWIEVEEPRRVVILNALDRHGCIGFRCQKGCCRKKDSTGHPVSNLGKVGSALTIKIQGSTIK